MSPVPDGYHVQLTIGGVAYPFVLPDPSRLIRTDLSSWTQRSASGALSLADLTHVAAFEQKSFHGGFGQSRMIEETRAWRTENVDTRTPGIVTLAPLPTITSAGVTGPDALYGLHMTADAEYLYVSCDEGAGTFVGQWDGTGLSDISSGLPASPVALQALWSNGTTLFAAPRAGTIQKYMDPGWDPVTGGGEVHNATCFAIAYGYQWHAQGMNNLIHYWSAVDGSDAETDTSVDSTHPQYDAGGDPGAVEVGHRGGTVKKMVAYGDMLYAARDDGLWQVRPEGAGFVAYKMDLTHIVPDTSNFEGLVSWGGALWMTINRRLYRYTGSLLTDVTPAIDAIRVPPTNRKTRILQLASAPGFLYALASNDDVSEDLELYAYDGTAWHQLTDELPISDTITTTPLGGEAFTQFGPRFGLHYYNEGRQLARWYILGGDARLMTWVLPDGYSRAYVNTLITGRLDTSRFDAGMLVVPKRWHRLTVRARIEDDGGTITIVPTSYRQGVIDRMPAWEIDFDDAVWDVAAEEYSPIIKTFEFDDTVVGNELVLTFELHSDTSAASPILYGYLLEYVPRPDAVYGYSVTLDLHDESETRDGRQAYRKAVDMAAILWQARESRTPLTFEDWTGRSARVYVSAIREQILGEREGHPTSASALSGDTRVMPDGGTIQIQLSLVEISSAAPDIYIGGDPAASEA